MNHQPEKLFYCTAFLRMRLFPHRYIYTLNYTSLSHHSIAMGKKLTPYILIFLFKHNTYYPPNPKEHVKFVCAFQDKTKYTARTPNSLLIHVIKETRLDIQLINKFFVLIINRKENITGIQLRNNTHELLVLEAADTRKIISTNIF